MAYAAGVGGLASSAVKTELGATATVFLWVAFASMALVTLGLVVMIISISLLDLLTDDEVGGTAASGNATVAEKVYVQHAFQPEPAPMRQRRWDDGDE